MFSPLQYRPRLSPQEEEIATALKSVGFYHHAHYAVSAPDDSECKFDKLVSDWRLRYDSDEPNYLIAECRREIFCKELTAQEVKNIEVVIDSVTEIIIRETI